MPSTHRPSSTTFSAAPAAQQVHLLEGFEGWLFDDCELRPHLQELKVKGRLVPLPKKALDLLVYLISERHRIVGHNELMARLWPGSPPSGRVLPATIAKLRAATDSDERQLGQETSAIRTVHRTGYRFVAPLQAILSPARPAPAPASSALPQAQITVPTARLRVGLLRCHNSTGLAGLNWAETGLMALAGHALARDGRLQVVNTETVVKWPDMDQQDLRAEASIRRLMDTLDLQVLVRCSLQKYGDTCALEFTLLAPGLQAQDGPFGITLPTQKQTLTAHTHIVQVLARQLAQSVEVQLFGEQAAAMRLESEDEFLNLAFARAVALFYSADYAGAADLMTVVCHMQPSSLAAEGWRVRAWAHANDPRVAAASVEFLARATASGDPITLATAKAAMGDQTFL